MFKGHNTGQRPVSVSDNPGHLARPVPPLPLQFPVSQGGPLVSQLAVSVPTVNVTGAGNTTVPAFIPDGFTFRKPVPKALADDYLRQCKECENRQKLEHSRAENQGCISHLVVLIAYLDKNFTTPLRIPLQDIPMWPTLNLVQVPDLLDMLGVSDLAGLELFARKNGFQPYQPILCNIPL